MAVESNWKSDGKLETQSVETDDAVEGVGKEEYLVLSHKLLLSSGESLY